jgi:hypothetical protein
MNLAVWLTALFGLGLVSMGLMVDVGRHGRMAARRAEAGEAEGF